MKTWNTTRGWPDGDNNYLKKLTMGPCEPANQKQIYFCAFCNGPGGTKHHLVPKAIREARPRPGNNMTIRLCRKCHDDVHYFFSHWELATRFNSEETLRNELEKRKQYRHIIYKHKSMAW